MHKAASARHETVRLTRRFSHTQSAKRAAARRVATQLATEGGYDAVTMGAVADRIGIGRSCSAQRDKRDGIELVLD